MKHLFNFPPPPNQKFRKGSGFMFRTILVILWCVPLFLFFFALFEYWEVDTLQSYLQNSLDHLNRRHAVFQKVVSENSNDKNEYQAVVEQTKAAHRSLRSLKFSWTALFATLEDVLPSDVKITRIRIKPEQVVGLTIEGEGAKLEAVTELLRRLYKHEKFDKPRLLNHALIDAKQEPAVVFSMIADYLPPLEVLP